MNKVGNATEWNMLLDFVVRVWYSLFMGIFSRKAKPVIAETRPVNTYLDPRLTWVRSVDDAEILEMSSTLIKQVEKLTAFRYAADREKSLNVLLTCLHKVQAVDRFALTPWQGDHFFQIINTYLPQLINTLRTDCLNEDEEVWAADNFIEAVLKLMKDEVDKLPQLLAKSRRKVVEAVTDRKVDLGNEIADARVKEITSLIAEADTQATSVEDRFTVEQSATAYLPDAIRLYTGLKNAPADVQAEATEIFVRQLDMIAAQLQVIIDRGATVSLGEMRAHLMFLEGKAKTAEPQLRLLESN